AAVKPPIPDPTTIASHFVSTAPPDIMERSRPLATRVCFDPRQAKARPWRESTVDGTQVQITRLLRYLRAFASPWKRTRHAEQEGCDRDWCVVRHRTRDSYCICPSGRQGRRLRHQP